MIDLNLNYTSINVNGSISLGAGQTIVLDNSNFALTGNLTLRESANLVLRGASLALIDGPMVLLDLRHVLITTLGHLVLSGGSSVAFTGSSQPLQVLGCVFASGASLSIDIDANDNIAEGVNRITVFEQSSACDEASFGSVDVRVKNSECFKASNVEPLFE